MLLLLIAFGFVVFWVTFFRFIVWMLGPDNTPKAPPKMSYPVRIRPRRQKSYLCQNHVVSHKILGILAVVDNNKCEVCKRDKK